MVTLTQLTELFVPDMVKRGRGRVMMMSSLTAYGASRAIRFNWG